jgi:hypothetical protein
MYEQLRSDVLSHVVSRSKGTAGMKLVLQSGIAAWARTSVQYLDESRTPVASDAQKEPMPYPHDLRSEAISILAGMLLREVAL